VAVARRLEATEKVRPSLRTVTRRAHRDPLSAR
jgi:hypothetical protein